MGGGLPYCWLCKYIRHSDRGCLKHAVVLPKSGGLIICNAYQDVQYSASAAFSEWKERLLTDSNVLYEYADGSGPEEYARFSDLEPLPTTA